MNVTIRSATASDIEVCGQIIYKAFAGIAERYQFPSDFSTLEFATQTAAFLIQHPLVFSVVALLDHQVVGVNFLDERNLIYAIGPIAVAPDAQGQGVGRQLMKALLERGQDSFGIRLSQDTVNLSSLSLYTSFGFEAKELAVVLSGKPKSPPDPAVEVRLLNHSDLEACAALCQKVYGFLRTGELIEALDYFSPLAVFRSGRLTAYASAVAFFGHGVAETEADLQALILGAGAKSEQPISFIAPLRQGNFLRWCLKEGFRMVKPITLMAMGDYQEPQEFFFPSVAY
jgi:predicted N-acetyltransferase YhbS